MRYFIVQQNNQLIHLPDCRFEEGKREIVEVPQIGGAPIFIQGRKQPDIFVFPVPEGVFVNPCVIVDENAVVRQVRVSKAEVGEHTYIAAGVVEDTYNAPEPQQAKQAISDAIKQLEKQ